MVDLSQYLLAGFSVLPKTTVTVDSVEVECVFNQSDHNDNNVLGGYEPENQATIAIKTSLLTSPRTLKGKIVIIDDSNWRVLNVKYGASVTHLTVIAASHT